VTMDLMALAPLMAISTVTSWILRSPWFFNKSLGATGSRYEVHMGQGQYL
jgi:hypothetical protein